MDPRKEEYLKRVGWTPEQYHELKRKAAERHILFMNGVKDYMSNNPKKLTNISILLSYRKKIETRP